MSNVDNNNAILLLSFNFSGSKHLSLAESCVSEKQSFNLTKSFVLDIELSAVPGKTVGNKLICMVLGGASTPSKFSGIIRSSFTLELSLKRARELAIHEKIVANNNVRQVNKLSDQIIVVKEILVNFPKLAVKSVFSKFGRVVSIKIQLIGLWQKALVEFELSEIADLNSVHVAKAVKDKQSWVFPVGTTAYDLSNLLESYSGKTCFIGHNPSSYVCDRCVVVCFGDKTSKLAAISSVPVYKDVNLHWAGLFLACCAKCKQLGHISTECSLGRNSGARNKWVVNFQNQIDKTWAQVASGSLFHVVSSVFSGAGVSSGGKLLSLVSFPPNVSGLSDYLAALECSLELLADCVRYFKKIEWC
ncbi:hypothetical protein G9A89_007431 [Geosiphon pyriformis]|nr:hypothetical protein G9A89_007431 [Geosiphon pyriformis]